VAAHIKGALKVDADYRIPVLFGHIKDHAITEDTSRVDHNIYPTEIIDTTFDDPFGSGEVSH
jgi:hypothetical protein